MSDTASPSAQLSARVVDLLIKGGLLRPERKAVLDAKISAGAMKSADWRLEIELSAKEVDAP